MGKIFLDTNIAIAILNDRPITRPVFHQYSHFFLAFPVVGELYFGALNSEKPLANFKRYRKFIEGCYVIDSSEDIAERYAEIRLKLKQKGQPIPENDIWIAAVCIANNLPLLTFDKHFDRLDELVIDRLTK